MLRAVFAQIVVAVAFAAYGVGEMTLALTLLPYLKSGTLLRMDRGYGSCWFWFRLRDPGGHFDPQQTAEEVPAPAKPGDGRLAGSIPGA